MITVHALAYNEEVIVKFMIDHYRARFSGCRIVVNASMMCTDNTVAIAKANGCEVSFDTHKHLSVELMTDIKNNCWKNDPTDWVLVCDIDELLDINQFQLRKEQSVGTTIIRSEGYHMVAMDDKLDLAGIKYGERDPAQDKFCLFNKKYIREINYTLGAHGCNPMGRAVYSDKAYKLYNYCYPNYGVTVAKYRASRARISPKDIRSGSPYYSETPEEICALYTEVRKKAIKVR